MNTAATQPTQVRITAIEATCHVHGWQPGSLIKTVFPLIDGYKDLKGNNIYVTSTLRNRSVHLASNEYEIVTP